MSKCSEGELIRRLVAKKGVINYCIEPDRKMVTTSGSFLKTGKIQVEREGRQLVKTDASGCESPTVGLLREISLLPQNLGKPCLKLES